LIIDSNVILDVVTADPTWYDWSVGHLNAAALHGSIFVNDVVFAEVSFRYDKLEKVEELFGGMGLVIERIPRAALFLAGHAHRRYRQSGGQRTGVLADFLVGAHAAVSKRPLLTRDRARYMTYFPTVEVVAPGEPSN
jgi:predicted nucleic acid-binding protein